MLTRSEGFCKWTLFGILLLSIAAPVPLILKLDLLNTYYVFDSILFFLLIITGVQGIVGLAAWIMLCRSNEKGKRLLIGTYLTTLAGFGLYSLYLLVTLLIPDLFYHVPLELISIFSLFANSAAVILLQHFWTRYTL